MEFYLSHVHFTHHHQPLRCEYSATATQFSRVTHRILALCMHAVCIGFLHFYHPRTLPRGLTGVLFLLLSPLPCLSLAPGDDTLLEFTSCCCQEGKRERVAMLYRSLFARHWLTRTIWCLLFLHSFLYPSCSLLLFLHPPNPRPRPSVYAVFLSGLWIFNIICLESSPCAGVPRPLGWHSWL